MPPKVLHVLPVDLPRGAQRYARALREALDGPSMCHRTLSLFDSPHRALDADIKLAVLRGPLSKLGFEPRAAVALRRALTHEQPSVVVAHGSEPLKYLVPLLSPALPLVYYKVGVATSKVMHGLGRRWHGALLMRPQRVAGVSQECLNEAETVFGVPKRKLKLIPNGRDPVRFRPAEAGAKGPPLLTFLGHFAESKRPAWFLDVVAQLRKEGIQFRARMIGSGPELAVLTSRAAQLDVELLGHRDDIPELLPQASVLAFTSIPSGEGMPGVFIEAGLCGVPVVSTDVPGARTVMADGQTGYVVAPEDLSGFVSRTRELLIDGAKREAMARAARERCLQHFTLDRSTQLWRELLEELTP